jgi:hypothetical protein
LRAYEPETAPKVAVMPPSPIAAPVEEIPTMPVNSPPLTLIPEKVNVGAASTSTFPIGITVVAVTVCVPLTASLSYSSSSCAIAVWKDGSSAETVTGCVNVVLPTVPVMSSVSR